VRERREERSEGVTYAGAVEGGERDRVSAREHSQEVEREREKEREREGEREEGGERERKRERERRREKRHLELLEIDSSSSSSRSLRIITLHRPRDLDPYQLEHLRQIADLL
jgi:hypothetical protein